MEMCGHAGSVCFIGFSNTDVTSFVCFVASAP